MFAAKLFDDEVSYSIVLLPKSTHSKVRSSAVIKYDTLRRLLMQKHVVRLMNVLF